MDTRLMRALQEAEGNIYSGMSLLKGAIVFSWTLLCLFLIGRNRSFAMLAASGAAFYTSLVVLCMYLFSGIGRYLHFPAENKKIPVFIGHKLDTIFTYPLLLMALIGLISNLLAATGIFHAPPDPAAASGGSNWAAVVSAMLLPLLAFAEELLNLLIVSFIYKYAKLKGSYRIIISILLAAFVFGFLHTFGQGANAAILIGIAYIPVFFATLYTGNIWISFLAHLYNDLNTLAKAYNSSLYLVITAAVALVPTLWALKTIFRKTH